MKNGARIILGFILVITVGTLNARQPEEKDTQRDFSKMRSKDFTLLIGGIPNGGKVNYNKDKTVVEGSGGIDLNKWLLVVDGAVGTTTNLSSLFNQDVLPTFNGNLSAYRIVNLWGLSNWSYSVEFPEQYDALNESNEGMEKINKEIMNNENYNYKFTYKGRLRERIREEKIKKGDYLYTFKRFVWWSGTLNYDRSKYLFYDPGRDFNAQLYNAYYEAWNGSLAVNGYFHWNKLDLKWKCFRPNCVYFKAAVQYGLSNNIEGLSKTSISDVNSTTTMNGITRHIVKNNNAYEGVYAQFYSIKPNFELILAPFELIALNFFGEYNYINSSDRGRLGIQNYGSIATGLYFYGHGESSKVNIGAYYKWTHSSLEGSDEVIGQVGLKTSIPVRVL